MESFKIGQGLVVTEGFEIEAAIQGKSITVEKGDKGFIDSSGFIHYTSGKARGKIQCMKDVKLKGFDHENIAKIILDTLVNRFEINEHLEGYDIEKKDFIDEIEYMLSEIL